MYDYSQRINDLKRELSVYNDEVKAKKINQEISKTVQLINNKMLDFIDENAGSEKMTIRGGGIFKKKKKIAVYPDTKMFVNFLSANSPLEYYLSASISMGYHDLVITEKDFPIIKTVMRDFRHSSSYSAGTRSSIECADNTSCLIYPLNIGFFFGDYSNNLKQYTESTKFFISNFYDYSNIYKIYYYDFKLSKFRQIKNNKIVDNDFMRDDDCYYLKIFPEFGYLFELGRLNIGLEEFAPKNIRSGLSKIEKMNHIDNTELADYIQYMMVGFSERNHDVDQNNIKLIKNRGWTREGTRYFLVKKTDRKMGIKVTLEKYGSDQNSMIWDDQIIKASEKLNDIL